MNDSTPNLVEVNYLLNPGFIYVTKTPTLVSAVLGSCVAVTLFDHNKGFGGMNHFQYPRTDDRRQATARFGNAATYALVQSMLHYGSKPRHLEAQIIGGAYNPEISPEDIGRENILAAREVLRKLKVPSVSEDVGGQKGRKVVFNTATNEMVVLKVERVRKGDWYPYESDR